MPHLRQWLSACATWKFWKLVTSKVASENSKEMWDHKCYSIFVPEVVFLKTLQMTKAGNHWFENLYKWFSAMGSICLASCWIKPHLPKTDTVTLVFCIVSIKICVLPCGQYSRHGLDMFISMWNTQGLVVASYYKSFAFTWSARWNVHL